MPTAAGSFLLNLPEPDLSKVAKLTDLQALRTDMTAQLKALSDQVAKLAQPAPAGNLPPNPPPPDTTTPAPNAGPWPPAAIGPGDTFVLPEGRFTGSAHIAADKATIKGLGMRRTILDGQGGAGSGHRLAWGKGVIHAGAPLTIQDLGFVGGGGGDNKSDAEAGFYAEGFEGPVNIVRVAFDGCENGIFVPWVDLAKCALGLDQCVFGRVRPNGLDDGRSHDMYVACPSVTVRRSIFLGNSKGNTVKVRGPRLLLEDNYIARINGRWVDLPGGTEALSRNNVYVTVPGSNVQNALGFYDEGDTHNNIPGSFLSDGDTFYFSRTIGEHIWINNADTRVEFRNAKVFWVGAPGAQPPKVIIDGPGKLTGANPFEFTLDNRVDAPPPPPADPTA